MLACTDMPDRRSDCTRKFFFVSVAETGGHKLCKCIIAQEVYTLLDPG